MTKMHIVILGAGPAGLGAAFKLVKSRPFQVTVLEQNHHVGGNAGSFDLGGLRVDYGSHRLHPACDPEIFEDIHTLLGDDLLDRPRHGRIRLRKHWIHFPLKPFDLAFKLPLSFSAGVGRDIAGKLFPNDHTLNEAETFATVMEKGLGKTICRDFYFPYTSKIWGIEPENLSVTLARRRVSNNSLPKMVKKILSALPGLKPKGSGRFYYPRCGYGQISEAYSCAAQEAGAQVLIGTKVTSVEMDHSTGRDGRHTIYYERDGKVERIRADSVWSTIPITALAHVLSPSPSLRLQEAARKIEYRAMILVYLVLKQDHFTEYDAHYFPEAEVPISRLSEPKNYSNRTDPEGRTVLCAELPCEPDGVEWNSSDGDLGRLVVDALSAAGLPVQAPVEQILVRRLKHAYPLYHQGYETFFDQLDEWTNSIDDLLTFGRQGLFAHDNTHHALFMAYSAVDCIDESGRFDEKRWQEYRRIFETHVVED
jgi:protoporphyrinogen oxidase